MLNFLLNTNSESFKMFFSMPQVWVAMVLCVLGIAMVVLARRITRVAKKTNYVADNDKTMITLKCIGIVCLFVCIIILVFIK